MNIFCLTSSNNTTDGWSNVSYNLLKLHPRNRKIVLSISSSRKNTPSLKSHTYHNFGILCILYDLIVSIYYFKKSNIILCAVEHFAILAYLLSRIFNVPYILMAHGTYSINLTSKYKLYRIAFLKADKILAISNFTKKKLAFNGISNNVEVLNLGVDKNIFFKSNKIRKDHSITFVGNLKPRKGLTFLLEAISLAKKKHGLLIKLNIIGNIDKNSEEFYKVNQYILKNNLEVSFLGKISTNNLVRYYQKAFLNILPSYTEGSNFEGFGLVHLEANACGTLSVGCNNSGNEDAIKPGNGFLIEYGDIKKLTKIIIKTYESRNKYKIDDKKIKGWDEVYGELISHCNQLMN
jgi:glycosyltransferase involved in cell wall biosynthesis